MKKTLLFCLPPLLLMTVGCQERDDVEQPDYTKAYVEVPRFVLEGAATSRTDITIDPVNGAIFDWNATDSLGVFPQQGYQAAFSVAGQPENNKAVFDGGTWRLRPNTTYAAYYPFSGEAYDLTFATLKACYRSQRQRGNNNTAHLPAHDYMASGFVTVNSSCESRFDLLHLGSLVRFVVNAPTADTWKYLCLKGVADEFMVDATYSLAEATRTTTPPLHAVRTADTVRIDMEGITTDAANQQIVLYAMVASNPAATPSEWAFTLRGEGGLYRDTLRAYLGADNQMHYPARYLEPGKAYSRSLPFSGVNLGEDWDIPINGVDDTYDPNEPILAPGYIGIRATTYEYEDAPSSRMDMHEGEKVTFTWNSSDVLGIFPVGGNQTAFPLSSQAGETLALFDGNDWALRNEWNYAAYFPFSQANFHISPNRLPVNFEGQQLDGRQPMAHIGRYNFSYAPLVKVSDNEPICFEMKGLAALVRITFRCPEPDLFKKLIVSDTELGIDHEATYDLMSAQPVLTSNPNIFCESLEFDMVNYQTLEAGEPMTVYLMLMPADHRAGNLTFTLVGELGTYQYVARGKHLTAGGAVSFDMNMERVTLEEENNNNPLE